MEAEGLSGSLEHLNHPCPSQPCSESAQVLVAGTDLSPRSPNHSPRPRSQPPPSGSAPMCPKRSLQHIKDQCCGRLVTHMQPKQLEQGSDVFPHCFWGRGFKGGLPAQSRARPELQSSQTILGIHILRSPQKSCPKCAKCCPLQGWGKDPNVYTASLRIGSIRLLRQCSSESITVLSLPLFPRQFWA